MTTVYARSAFYPGLRFTLSLQSAFYTVCILPLVRSLQSAVRSLRFTLTECLPKFGLIEDNNDHEIENPGS